MTNDEGDATWTNRHGSVSVIDLLFCSSILARVCPQVIVDLEGRGHSDHAIFFLAFGKQTPHWGRSYIAHDSEEEASFLSDVAQALIASSYLEPELAGQHMVAATEAAWNSHSKPTRIDSNPNSWWTDDCQIAKDLYLLHRTRAHLKAYNDATKNTHQQFFMHRIELMTENNTPWDGIRWTKPRPPPKYSVIMKDGAPIADMPTLFDTMHSYFLSSAARPPPSIPFLNSLPQHPTRAWYAISKQEVIDMLKLTSNASAPGPDEVTWYHIKQIIDMEGVLEAVVQLFNNICASGVWPSWFKTSLSVIIPKPKKTDYSVPKSYCPIALLNTMGKLLTKVLANRMQYDAAAFSLLHEGQCSSVQKHTTVDAGLVLLDFINTNCERGWHTSVCAINVAQFFPSLDHGAVTTILSKLGFPMILVNLITSYFAGRSTNHQWDTAMSQPYDFSMGMPQGDCLSPIISALFLSVAIKNVFPHSSPPKPTRCLFFVDDGTLYTASPSLSKNVQVLASFLVLLLKSLANISLSIEPSKTELIHFFAFQLNASTRTLARVHQPNLNFTWNEESFSIKPAAVWWYLGFFFTPSLDWSYHIQFYANKGFSLVRVCNMLGNSIRGIGPRQRALGYQAAVLPVLTYGLCLWYVAQGAGVIKHVKRLERVHSFAMGWITGTFRTTPTGARGVIAGIPPPSYHP